MTKVSIIGLGEIGLNLFNDFKKTNHPDFEIYGQDTDEKVINTLRLSGYRNVSCNRVVSDIYIITVYWTKDVKQIIRSLLNFNRPLVIIESTLGPGTYASFFHRWYYLDIVLFPHRYNPNDPNHRFFNLDRVIGGGAIAVERAINFYKNFMDPVLIHVYPPEIVELAKPLENAYRFLEIAIAEEIRLLCNKKGISFNELREAMNTKWNIDIKEPREGIYGKCLPKDTKLSQSFLKSKFLKLGIQIDEYYKKNIKPL